VIPKRLELVNFISHIHSVVDFDKFNSALILGSYNNSIDESNGAGKSTVLEAIRWALFDKARHKKKDDIVKRDCISCTVIFEFLVDNNTYRITRKRNKVVSETDVVLEQWNGSLYEKIDCDTNTATDNRIVQIINFTHDVFINSVYFKQGDISIFTESTPGKRKDILKSLLKLDRWDQYQKKVKKYYSKTSTQISEKQQSCLSLDSIESEIEKSKANLKRIQKNLDEKNKSYEKLNKILIERRSEFQYLDEDNGHQKLELLKEDFVVAKKRISKVKKSISLNKRAIDNNKIEVSCHKDNLKDLKKRIQDKKGINIEKKRVGLVDGTTKEKIIRSKIDHLKQDLRLDNQCETCFRKIGSPKEAQHIKELRKSELIMLKKKHSLLVQKLKVSIAAFKQLESLVSDGRKAEIEK